LAVKVAIFFKKKIKNLKNVKRVYHKRKSKGKKNKMVKKKR